MQEVTITRIPIPDVILKGDWHGIVYAIDTRWLTLGEHHEKVEESINKIKKDFDENNHVSVSLRQVKKEFVYEDKQGAFYCTLVQFRIRDSY